MQVALEPAALGVAGLDGARAGCAQRLELGAQLGFQALVVECEPRRRADLLEEPGIVEQGGAVPEHGDGVPAAHKRRDGSPIPLRQLDGEPGGVDLAALVEGVGELQLRIPEGAGERVANPARGGRLAKLNHEARHLVAGPPATHPRQHHAESEHDQRGGLARPQPLLDLVVGEESAAEAVGVVGGDEPEIHHRREQHGRRQEPRRG